MPGRGNDPMESKRVIKVVKVHSTIGTLRKNNIKQGIQEMSHNKYLETANEIEVEDMLYVEHTRFKKMIWILIKC